MSIPTILDIMSHSPILFIGSVGLFSLLIGSFLNVVILRLPPVLKCKWRQACFEFLEQPDPQATAQTSYLELVLPSSNCPKCKMKIKFYDNIPILSYLLLRGKCRNCHKPISIQYPIVEGITMLAGILVAWRFGVTWQTFFGCILTYVLIVQSMIDVKHTLIPDEITLPVLWVGILLSLIPIFAAVNSSILGAVAGYLSLWLIYWLFFIATGKEGMGFGDFKLSAMLGAWFGWQMLPFIILFSSVIGTVVGLIVIIAGHKSRNTQIPFGPFLAIAGWIAMLWGPEINSWYVTYFGTGFMIVGLTGGIGAGKSTVVKFFNELGVPSTSADNIAREILNNDQNIRAQIIHRFNTERIDVNGSIDRSFLRSKIFSSPDDKRWLESLLHPIIREKIFEFAHSISYPYCVIEIPLLFEANMQDLVDLVLTVDAPLEVQIARTVARDKTTPEAVQSIINAQINREIRLAKSDDIITNTGDLEELKALVQQLHSKYVTNSLR